ncbi:MAG: hypothetical protein KKB89_03770, partial [Candidatus Omnitrophica bacterium]|nr:hypothetical protein [Candidatus Omnitrophota bacterium]
LSGGFKTTNYSVALHLRLYACGQLAQLIPFNQLVYKELILARLHFSFFTLQFAIECTLLTIYPAFLIPPYKLVPLPTDDL